VLKETSMQRPDVDTLACVHAACQLLRQAGAHNLVIRKVSGQDRLRLLRCRRCGEEYSARRGTALFHTKRPEARAEDVINYLGEGGSVRATTRLVQVATETVARLVQLPGRHAERCHDQQVHGLPPRALECDERWSWTGGRMPPLVRYTRSGIFARLYECAFGSNVW
jgi:transposase-like protein